MQTERFEFPTKIHRSAAVSSCARYRWWLRRSWHADSTRDICFVMLNPSTADACRDDPTIRRCIAFARAWGYSSVTVRNLFALRATDPKELLRNDLDVVGGSRADQELAKAQASDLVVAAWGSNPPLGRDRIAIELIKPMPIYCLGKTKNGYPSHPLYVRADKALELYAG